MINPETEEIITAKEAARHPALRRDGRAPHVSTIYRLFDNARRGVGGAMVKLETIKMPWGRATSKEAIRRYVDGLNGSASAAPPSRQHDLAHAELQRRGLA